MESTLGSLHFNTQTLSGMISDSFISSLFLEERDETIISSTRILFVLDEVFDIIVEFCFSPNCYALYDLIPKVINGKVCNWT